MDLRMPLMDGIEATRRIRRQAPRTQVVILTAYEDESAGEGAEDAGVYCYLVKGCSLRLVLDVIRRAATAGAELVEPDRAACPAT